MSLVALVALCGGSVAWWVLARTVFYTGPCEWDDVMYMDKASRPSAMWEIRNRYVHVWALRSFQLLFSSRELAASVYATAIVIGIAWIAFAFGRRIGGVAAGLVAAALVPLYPSLLRYLTSPMVDPPMVLWSLIALLCAVASAETPKTGRALFLAGVSGLGCYLAVKTKETGLAVLPAVAWALASNRRSLVRCVPAWLGGVAVGWLAHVALDATFLPGRDAWRPSDWDLYWRPSPRSRGIVDLVSDDRVHVRPRGELMRRHFTGELLDMPLLPFTLMGVAGAMRRLRDSSHEARAARALAVWVVAALVLSSLVAWHFRGIQAEFRYCGVMGVPLIVLAADWLVARWRRDASSDAPRVAAWLAVIFLAGVGVVAVGFVVASASTTGSGRATYFGAPVAAALLFLACLVRTGPALTRGALAGLVVLACGTAVAEESRRAETTRARMAPWHTLVAAADAAGANIVSWKAPHESKGRRLERRVRSLSRRPAAELRPHRIQRLDRARPNEWVITTLRQSELLEQAGWKRVVRGATHDYDDDWVVYRRR